MKVEICDRVDFQNPRRSRHYDLVTMLLEAEVVGKWVKVSLEPGEKFPRSAIEGHLTTRTLREYETKGRCELGVMRVGDCEWLMWLRRQKPQEMSR